VDPGYENPDFKFKDKVKYHSVINILHPIDVTAVEEDDDGDGDGDNHSPMQ
jgi:hypothetical protein